MIKSPTHIAIIMDGNGRWAKQQNMPRYYGHRKGAENIMDVATYCNEAGIKYLTLYAFSTENWSRPANEVHFLTTELPFLIYNQLKNKLQESNMRLKISGRSERVPQKTLDLLTELVQKSQNNTGLCIVLAFNYGGKAEIVDACKKIIADCNNTEVGKITEETFREYLYLPEIPDVDLLIRPGGEHRLSNFLLWQSAYAELYFSDNYWPEFSKEDINSALEFYRMRQRKFGKV